MNSYLDCTKHCVQFMFLGTRHFYILIVRSGHIKAKRPLTPRLKINVISPEFAANKTSSLFTKTNVIKHSTQFCRSTLCASSILRWKVRNTCERSYRFPTRLRTDAPTWCDKKDICHCVSLKLSRYETGLICRTPFQLQFSLSPYPPKYIIVFEWFSITDDDIRRRWPAVQNSFCCPPNAITSILRNRPNIIYSDTHTIRVVRWIRLPSSCIHLRLNIENLAPTTSSMVSLPYYDPGVLLASSSNPLEIVIRYTMRKSTVISSKLMCVTTMFVT